MGWVCRDNQTLSIFVGGSDCETSRRRRFSDTAFSSEEDNVLRQEITSRASSSGNGQAVSAPGPSGCAIREIARGVVVAARVCSRLLG